MPYLTCSHHTYFSPFIFFLDIQVILFPQVCLIIPHLQTVGGRQDLLFNYPFIPRIHLR